MKWAFAISIWTLLSGPVLFTRADEHGDLLRELKVINTATPVCPCGTCNCGGHRDDSCGHKACLKSVVLEWVWDTGRWYLYRGQTCLGATNTSGVYYEWTGTDYGCKMRPPVAVPPMPQSAAPQVVVCRT